MSSVHVEMEWSNTQLLDLIAEETRLPGKQASRPAVVAHLMDHHWKLDGRWVCPTLRWKLRDDPFTKNFTLRLDAGYVDELKHVRGLSAGAVIEHLLLARCEPRVEDGITRLTYVHPDGLKVKTGFVPLPSNHWFEKYAHRAAIRNWFRVGRWKGEPDPRSVMMEKEGEESRKDEQASAEYWAREDAKVAARVAEVTRMATQDEGGYYPSSRYAPLLKEEQRYMAERFPPKRVLTAEEKFEAEWKRLNEPLVPDERDLDWSQG